MDAVKVRTGCDIAAAAPNRSLSNSMFFFSLLPGPCFVNVIAVTMSTSLDPYLCSTSVVEDADNDDEVIGLKLSYVCNECYFSVCVSTESAGLTTPGASLMDEADDRVIAHLMNRFNEACTWNSADISIEDVDKRLDPLWQEAEDLVKTVAFDDIRNMSRIQGRTSELEDSRQKVPQTLAEYIYPKTFNLQIVEETDQLRVVWRPDLPPSLPFAVELKTSTYSELTCVSPEEVKILEMYRTNVLRVEVSGHVFCCKLSNTDAQASFLRELETLRRISNSELGPEVRIPQLRGLIASEEGIIGLLVDWIDTEAPDLSSLLRLRDDITYASRQQWKEQIAESVARLHALDITWGDVKTSNVLIDRQYNAWLVDFGGGFTKGWVDEALSDTKAGDLQGLQNTLRDILMEGDMST